MMKTLKFCGAYVIAVPALAMPYRVRLSYIAFLAFVIHAPYRVYGRVAHALLDQLHIEPLLSRGSADPGTFNEAAVGLPEASADPIAILYSGGTDSTCAAALAAKTARRVHLLTYFERATQRSPIPRQNVDRLRTIFPGTTFTHDVISVDDLVRFFSYRHYVPRVRRHGLLVLATCGFSSLSWHVRTIRYCKEKGISLVWDGMTRELMHFPGHMDAVLSLIRELYAAHGIRYENPVRDWPVPPDKQYIEQLIINHHAADIVAGDAQLASERTTGRYLYDIGMFDRADIKGTHQDRSMQHDCYPFALYNIVAFWRYLSVLPETAFAQRVEACMKESVSQAHSLLENV